MSKDNIDAMQAFRRRYRLAIKPGYNGWLHMGIVALVGFSFIIYALSKIQNATILQWCVYPLTLLIVNFAEYYSHRWLGHRKTYFGKLFYRRHAGDHHGFFLEKHMEYQSVKDWRVVLFPVYLIIAFIFVLIIPVAYLLFEFTSLNIAYVFSAAGISGYIFYEVMHFSYHLPTNSTAYRIFLLVPGWKLMRLTHVLHHKHENMGKVNFNITLPIFDIVLGTLYLGRRA